MGINETSTCDEEKACTFHSDPKTTYLVTERYANINLLGNQSSVDREES